MTVVGLPMVVVDAGEDVEGTGADVDNTIDEVGVVGTHVSSAGMEDEEEAASGGGGGMSSSTGQTKQSLALI